jgi:MATE family multidrug resistance protein
MEKQASLEETLLPRSQPEWKEEESLVASEEVKRQLWLAGPLIAGNLMQNLVPMISVMLVGHLGELPLAGASMANSFATVTGFSLLVRAYTYLFCVDILCFSCPAGSSIMLVVCLPEFTHQIYQFIIRILSYVFINVRVTKRESHRVLPCPWTVVALYACMHHMLFNPIHQIGIYPAEIDDPLFPTGIYTCLRGLVVSPGEVPVIYFSWQN